MAAILAALINPSRSEVEPMIGRFLVEIGTASMTDADARWLLVRAGVEAVTGRVGDRMEISIPHCPT